MRYQMLDVVRTASLPMVAVLQAAHKYSSSDLHPLSDTRLGRTRSAILESAVRLIKHYPKQGFEYGTIEADGRKYHIKEDVAVAKPFANLLHFSHIASEGNPKVLFVPALSGHHATLSEDTFREFLPDHDVYVADWLDARDVPVSDGRFGFEEYVAYVIEFLEHIGPDTHVIGLCQASVPALTAVAYMAAKKHACRPPSLTIMAGPVDTSVNKNRINKVSEYLSSSVLNLSHIHAAPIGYKGVGRKVYPGIMQLAGFIMLNPSLHIDAHVQFAKDVMAGDHEAADRHRDFYDEYFAMLDTTAEFYLETLERVFFDQHLAKGMMKYQGETVDCAAISDIFLLTVEGSKDNMCSPGQTRAAHDICSGLAEEYKEDYMQEGVGHYGVFNGSKYRQEIAPRVKAFIQRAEKSQKSKAAA
ncbi:MAG: polyhydroxyalkanoate depolymerase [Pseudomonadales bacterium]